MVGKITAALTLTTMKLIHDSCYTYIIRTSDLLIIRSADTDVLDIAIHHFYQITKDWRNKDMVMHVGMSAHKSYIFLSTPYLQPAVRNCKKTY